MAMCILSKGGQRALRDIDLFRPDRDAYAATLTSLDDDFSRNWERNAPLRFERIAALRAFYERGIFTWVSLERTLDVEASLAIVRATAGFVDLYKIGKANRCGALTKTTDWRDYTLRMVDLLTRWASSTTSSRISRATCRPITPTRCGCRSTTEGSCRNR